MRVIVAVVVVGSSACVPARPTIHDEPVLHNHLSVVLGSTRTVDTTGPGFTLGGDYEYKASGHLGVGVVAEHAFGSGSASTMLAVADLHFWRGLMIQTGPGVEVKDHEVRPVGRLGVGYELELSAITLAPQVQADISWNDVALVVGVGIGHAF